MPCYCQERENNLKLAESMKDIPKGYCGYCEICGEPGHMKAHPRQARTGTWCDKHWDELMSYRVFSLGDIIQFIFNPLIIVITIIFIYSMSKLWKMFF